MAPDSVLRVEDSRTNQDPNQLTAVLTGAPTKLTFLSLLIFLHEKKKRSINHLLPDYFPSPF